MGAATEAYLFAEKMQNRFHLSTAVTCVLEASFDDTASHWTQFCTKFHFKWVEMKLIADDVSMMVIYVLPLLRLRSTQILVHRDHHWNCNNCSFGQRSFRNGQLPSFFASIVIRAEQRRTTSPGRKAAEHGQDSFDGVLTDHTSQTNEPG